ncbi:phenol hydroxylase subunit [Thiomonas sp. FB-Cd]|uniref:phenol hydroxylase subunit n=1 Tax=Thiomonas sp. FB-Cd TaxID=1158292 RepID=UPI0004DEE472|nr:phenol hydroxylase subunit [Thiomonas sp. FB-Cd]
MHRQAVETTSVKGRDDFNPQHRFVKVTGINAQGFVEFEFAVGSPELCVELMLPPAAFEEFCLTQKAVRLDALGLMTRH